MYKVGDRFVITKKNECLWDVDTVVEIIDIAGNDRYKYNIASINDTYDYFWLCSNEEDVNEQEWNIDNFATLVSSPQQLKYKVGDRFKVFSHTQQFGNEFTIKEIDIDTNNKLPYLTDNGWHLGDANTWNGEIYNIDSFARLIENEEYEECTKCTNEECTECVNEECDNKYNFTTYGEMRIVGRCYEDVVSILMANGYIVQVEKNDVDDFNKATFNIAYGKKEN